MKKSNLIIVFVILLLAFAKLTFAHVKLTNPTGKESFKQGEQVTISWQLLVNHQQNNWDLLFSKDGGNTWEIISADIETSKRSFVWTVPNITTTSAKIKIIQDNLGLNYEDESDNFSISSLTSIKPTNNEIPSDFKLFNNYPNPFNPSTVIRYSIPKSSFVNLSVYNLLGQKIKSLVNKYQNSGNYSINFDASLLNSGTYIYKLQTKNFSKSKKMQYIK